MAESKLFFSGTCAVMMAGSLAIMKCLWMRVSGCNKCMLKSDVISSPVF